MESSKCNLSSTKTRSFLTPACSPQDINQQIHYLRRLEEYHEDNEALLLRIHHMEEELSKKNANRPVETGLSEVLADLSKQNSKLESEISKTVHRQNVSLAEIKVRKESVKLARNERVIHSGIFKNI